MSFDAKGATRQGQRQVAMQFGCGVRGYDDPVLFGQFGDAQRLGEAGSAGRIELDIADGARDNESVNETGTVRFHVDDNHIGASFFPDCKDFPQAIECSYSSTMILLHSLIGDTVSRASGNQTVVPRAMFSKWRTETWETTKRAKG